MNRDDDQDKNQAPKLKSTKNRLANLEFNPNLRTDNKKKSAPSAVNYRKQELTPNPTSRKTTFTQNIRSSRGISIAKKSSPAMAFIAIVGLILFLVAAFAPFPLLIVHWSQTLVDNLNYQEPSINNRSKIAVQNKINHAQSPPSKYQVVEDYYSVSDKLKQSFKDQGFEVETDDNHRLTKFKYKKYDDLSGDKLLTASQSDPDLMLALNRAVASRYLSFSDGVWQTNANFNQLTKAGLGGSDEEEISVESLQENELKYTKLNHDQYRFNTQSPENPDDNNQQSLGLLDSIRQNLDKTNQVADELAKQQATPDNHQFDNLSLIDQNFVTNNTVCGALQTSTFQKDYNKTFQRSQLAKLTSAFLSDADQIKAGESSAVKAEYWGKRLNSGQNYLDSEGKPVTTKSASDSYAYQWLAYGDTGNLDLVAQKYVAGANQVNSRALKTINAASETIAGRAALALCKVSNFTKTTFGDFFSLIPSTLVQLLLGNHLSSQIVNVIDNKSSHLLTNNTLSAMTGRRVDPGTSGEDLGNSLVTGAGYLFGQQSRLRGNPILTKKQAVAYLAEQRTFVAQKNQYDRQQRSPFDLKSPNSFLGNLTLNLLSILQTNSSASIITSFSSLFNNSLASLSPIFETKAMAADLDSFSYCEDPDILALNKTLPEGEEVAVDPMCNLIYGSDVTADDQELPQLVDQLVADDQLQIKAGSCNENGQNCQLEPVNEFANYITDCIEPDNPNQAKCLADSNQKTYYANYITDNQINNFHSDNPSSVPGSSPVNSQTVTAPTSSPSGPATLDQAQNSGWGGFSNGKIPADKLAPIPFKTNHKLHPDAASSLGSLNEAYKAKFGKDIAMTDSYRSYDAQVACRRAKGSICAVPGTSNHGWGLAVDLAGGINNFSSTEHKWMLDNAPNFGWVSPPWARPGGRNPEPWHWEYAKAVN